MSRPTTALLVGVLVTVAAVGSAGIVLAFSNDAPSSALQPGDSSRSITVTASGHAEAQPDTAVLRIAVEAADPEATTARSQVAENVSSVKAALAELGIDDSHVTTTGYRIYYDENREPRPGEESQPAVYRVRHTLSIEVNQTENVGSVIDTVVDAGATNIYDVGFTISTETRNRLQNEALSSAMSNARSQAETLADSASVSLVDVRTVQTGVGGDVRPVAYETAVAGSAGTDVNAGPVTVRATVTVTYDVTG
ncbi:MAG: SIMPL domain-containing protein [Halanaeroarchaeum sp.]